MTADEPARRDALGRERLEAYFRAAAFAVLALLGGIAAFRAYFALEHAILVWLQPQYVSLVQAGFSLVLLGIAVWLLKVWVIARAR